MELEYNADLDEYFIIIPESIINKLNWEEEDFLDFTIDDEVLTIIKSC